MFLRVILCLGLLLLPESLAYCAVNFQEALHANQQILERK